MEGETRMEIRILKNGPYIVKGGVKLSEKVIVPKGKGYVYKEGRELPQAKTYSLCRCGRSKNAPFCDGAHEKGFYGAETCSRDSYANRSEVIEGPTLDLMDDGRCAFARFCHRADGTAWDLTIRAHDERLRKEVIAAASECPAGRLTAVDKDGNAIEPEYEPEIVILQDPQQGVSGGIFVKGGIPLVSADGREYELRNRYVLCRCGKSRNKPFCDAMHVTTRFKDD